MSKTRPSRLTATQIVEIAEHERQKVGGGTQGLEVYWLTIVSLMRLM